MPIEASSIYYMYLNILELKLHIYVPLNLFFIPKGVKNGYRIYLDIMKICHKVSLLIWTTFIGQFVHPVGGEGTGLRIMGVLLF